MTRAARTFASLRTVQQTVDKDAVLVAVSIYQALSTDHGRVLLAWLRESAKEVLPSDASDSALRMKEGKRQLVAEIENQFRRGERESSRPGQ